MGNNQILDYERIRFIHLLLTGFIRFREVYEAFREDGTLPRCRVAEDLCSGVFEELRNRGHRIFRQIPENEEEAGLHDVELLCDLVVGACYHEALQLQENLYLSKLYRPRYEDLRRQMTDSSFEEYFQIGENLIREAETQIPLNLNWIWQLLLEGLTLLKRYLSVYGRRKVILRFVTRNLELFRKAYSKEDRDELYRAIYPGGLAELLMESVEDLVRSAHYHAALDRISQMAGLLHVEDLTEEIDMERIRSVLRKIHSEGRLIRDNNLVTRSENLSSQMEAEQQSSA